ncbi:hypothetical protein [Sporosarcina sp. SAFN-015]|uniref:hypothetical protein n=1 Tax=Sporosarcina sp. SAFN-015 TaxID=3387274 RepID=UPI003F80E563
MLFVMMTILIFSIPGILLLWTAIDFKLGKKDKIPWKLIVILLIVLTSASVLIQIYLLQAYSFPIFQTNIETIIGISIVGFLAGIILIINLFITKTMGKKLPKSVHDPKTVNVFTLCIAIFLFIILFIAAPTGKKIAYATSIHQAMAATEDVAEEEFSVLLVTSERECLRQTTSCRNSAYSNQFFIKSNINKTQEVQVKIRALNSSNQEMKVIDSKIMTLEPNELRLLETEETNEEASVWNKYSFQTNHRVSHYEQMIRYRDVDE